MPSSTITFGTVYSWKKSKTSQKSYGYPIQGFCGFSHYPCTAACVFSFYSQHCPYLPTCGLPTYIAMATLVRSFGHFPLSFPIKEIHDAFHSCFHYMANCMVNHPLLHHHHHNTFHFLSSDPSPPIPGLPKFSKETNITARTYPENSTISSETSLSSHFTPLL